MKGNKLASFLVTILVLLVWVDNTIADDLYFVERDDVEGPAAEGPDLDDEFSEGPSADGPVSEGSASDGPVSEGPASGGPVSEGAVVDDKAHEASPVSEGAVVNDKAHEANPVSEGAVVDEKAREAQIVENINICLSKCQPEDPKAEICPTQCVINEVATQKDLLAELIKTERKAAKAVFCMVGCEGSRLCHNVNTLEHAKHCFSTCHKYCVQKLE